ncbi:hypothetical protein AGABI1DRAFT_105587 [Agaricus bisporus var. burnettii JB137-S8]|uniref:Uncharacterized protein n=1 Tax=Agaricus bisporus var. burnettii (strain JB137-S8 / ATCC MYA-4627 / FGSC 10392) TaxID=597362 RepID=K5XYZ5_AGABU|nr:uncharacterized protein AGABI1DRAFT_105587 [Agaricus bisporus var. burnettii JB137-S8]EKM80590.1 hypothetical protein AGABI1DRAFT_105587 [Agaricus bisporus var. burnettii JB137-S8]
MPASANVWDPRPRPGFIGVPPTRDPRPRPHVRLDPASGSMDSSRSTRDPRPQCPPINLPTSFQLHPELSLPSPTTPSESSGQVVAMNSRPAGRKWLTREDLKQLPKISKIRYDANVAPTSTSGLEPKTTLAISTSTPMPPPQLPPNLEQRHDSSDSGIATRPSATQRETGKSMTTSQQRHFSPQTPTGPSSRQVIATNEPSCSEISQVLSLPITPPLTPTEDFTSRSLCQINCPEAFASSMKRRDYYSSIQERDSIVSSWGRKNGVQSTLKPETKETTGPLENTLQNRVANFQSASPLKNAGNITSHIQNSSPPARAVTDANGRTVTQRAADYPPAPATQQARSPKEFNMESYDSCDCTSDGGEECMCCRILKGAFEFCQRVDQMVKER